MKKIGIMTMHRVLNCGSALQAYSLQQFLENNGYDVEIIDYIYPNKYHKSYTDQRGIFRKFASFIYHNFLIGDLRKLRSSFNRFYKKYLKLSPSKYRTINSLKINCPKYDCYISGSDQVWNPRYIRYDTSFMLSFVLNSPKISYSSSFSVNSIPNEFKDIYASCLKDYKHISIRESSSSNIINELISKDSTLVVDPTLLLEPSDFLEIAKSSNIVIDQPYILVYVLGYAWDPYPYVVDIINRIDEDLKLPIVVLSFNTKYLKRLNSSVVEYAPTPENFIYLFSRAKFVITDSYHGTIFSVKYNVPFYSLVQSDLSVDSRVKEFLKSIGAEDRCLHDSDGHIDYNYNVNFQFIENKLYNIVEASKKYLLEALIDSLK